MKIYTKLILDNKNNIIEEKYFDYRGLVANAMGIHYTYGANKNNKLMEKKAKREKKLAEKKAKRLARLAKEGSKKDDNKASTLDASKPITLDFLTNPDKE